MKTPEGGPRDTTPPKVVKSEPKNLSTNFKSDKIVIDFDEYIKLTNEFKEFTISPEQEKPPILKAKLKRLEITLQDSLEKNTTYTLNFGKAVTDINEGNAIKNFSYVFSTGPRIDSLSIAGSVKNALTLQPEIDAIVLAIPLARDSIFGKRKPSIYTVTDSSGNFKLNNLKKDQYKIYALKEKSGDKIYQQFNDEVGFIKDPITLDRNIDSLQLTIFKELASVFRIIDRKLNNDGSISMNFNQQLRKPSIQVIDPMAIDQGKLVQFNRTNDSVRVWLADLSFDSVKVVIKDEQKGLDTVKFTRGKKETYTRNITAGDNLQSGLLNPNNDLQLSFNFPIQSIDPAKITLLEDSIPRKGFTLVKDSSNILNYTVKYPWKKKEKYILKLNEGALTAIFNAKNKEINKTFMLGSEDDYGTLTLKINVPDTAKSYILEIVNEKKDVVVTTRKIVKSGPITLLNYRTGTYFARIVYDANKNGIWDTGNIKSGIQPEKIWYVPGELRLRANWIQEAEVNIP
ncbi:MAG: Ig-like domain-containing protein [Pedobacter sp.]|nr:Ig-like domain-containing protein [Pedobacter sp.]MDQ8052527.1 Ig-like domain-containing protein [Pedobacter sp.]